LVKAQSETSAEVIAVIARPWVVLNQGGVVPAKIELTTTAVPTEYNVTYTLPPFEPNYFPEAVVTEATSSAIVNNRCLETSPCGRFDVSRAATYAEYWGDPQHPRNPFYHDYGSENCTNFISQILARGDVSFMRAFEHGDGSWWYYNTGLPSPFNKDDTESWRKADVLPRHLWRFGLADIDSSNQPSGWSAGNIIAEDWYGTNGKGDLNHLQFVVDTTIGPNGVREPLIANESSAGANYSRRRWSRVKESIEESHGQEWSRISLAVKHTTAALSAKKHDPANLYGPNGVFSG
jgi:hypothetical protein